MNNIESTDHPEQQKGNPVSHPPVVAKQQRKSKLFLLGSIVLIALLLMGLVAYMIVVRITLQSKQTKSVGISSPSSTPAPTSRESSGEWIMDITAHPSSERDQTPISFVVTDPNGLQTGYDATTSAYLTNIPHASYGQGGQGRNAPDAVDYEQYGSLYGTYKVLVYARENGSYYIDVTFANGQLQDVMRTTLNGTAIQGHYEIYLITILRDKPYVKITKAP